MNKFLKRLVAEWTQHGKIIIAVDFDDTISPWKWETEEDKKLFRRVIEIINAARAIGAYVVVFTASPDERFDHIREYCRDNELEIDGINENVLPSIPYGHGKKIYANIFIDDRAGLLEALKMLADATTIMSAINHTKSEPVAGSRHEVLDIILKAANKYPELRIGQILFNLGINEFADNVDPAKENHRLRDIYNDSSEKILGRIKESNFYKQISEDL